MRSMSIEHSEMRFGRRGRTMMGRVSTGNSTEKKLIDLIHGRNSSIDVDILYNLIPTEIYKVSIIFPILQMNKLEFSH